MLGFAGQGGSHIIPIFGHTFNDDTWAPNAERGYFNVNLHVIPSETWVSTFVCHDDNFGSNFCLPRSYLVHDQQQLAIGLMPEFCRLSPILSEVLGSLFLYNFDKFITTKPGEDRYPWIQRLIIALKASLVVTRPILLSADSYLAHLSAITGWKGGKVAASDIASLSNYLKGNFWMIEFSVQDLFPTNKRKLGEILINCSQESPNPDNLLDWFILARFPGTWLIPDQAGILNQFKSAVHSHTELYKL